MIAAPPFADMGSRTTLALPAPRTGGFVCDGIDRPVVYLVGQGMIVRIDKATRRRATIPLDIGGGDPGAGQIYYPLRRGGREIGNVHAVNPGMINPPASATTPVITSVTLGGETVTCRWLAGTRLNAVTDRRSVTVTREGGALIYRSFDFSHSGPELHPDGVQRTTRPTLELRGGREERGADGARVFAFAHAGYRYVLHVPSGIAGATLAVARGGRVLQSEPLLGYTLAR